MGHDELKEYAFSNMEKYPQHKQEIMDLWELYLDEVTEGASPFHERLLCYNSIKQLIEE